MKFGELLGKVSIVNKELEIFSNGDTGHVSEEFCYNEKRVKLGMNHQCVQLIRKYYHLCTGKDSYSICPDLNATCWFRYREKLGLEEIMYDNVEEGDIVVFSGGEYGHIALIQQVTESGFFIVQQNFFNDERDINYFISFQTVEESLGLYDQNDEEFIIEDFLRIS